MCCRGVQGIANPAFLGGFLCSGLLRVAPYCVRSGIRVVSTSPRSGPSQGLDSPWLTSVGVMQHAMLDQAFCHMMRLSALRCSGARRHRTEQRMSTPTLSWEKSFVELAGCLGA